MALRLAIDPAYSWMPVPQNATRATLSSVSIDLDPYASGTMYLRARDANGNEAGNVMLTLTSERAASLRAALLDVARAQLAEDATATPTVNPATGEPIATSVTVVDE